MDNDIAIKKLLHDIKTSIENIEKYLGKERVYEKYTKNPLLQDAVERNLITIGEAMNALLKINSDLQITNSRRIVDARNKLTHGYDEIDHTQVWNIIVLHMPLLKKEVMRLLAG